MKWELLLIVLVLTVVTISGLPARVKRQGFLDYIPETTTQGTTTTTPSPKYTACIRGCGTTPQYNPVCGTNQVTYRNEGDLNCARRCGARVEVSFLGSCSPAT